MSFLEKLFGSKKKETKQDVKSKDNEGFQFILTTEVIRECIKKEVMPIKEEKDISNLQLAYGVADSKNRIFLTRIACNICRDSVTGNLVQLVVFVVMDVDKRYKVFYKKKGFRKDSEKDYTVPSFVDSETGSRLIKGMQLWDDEEQFKLFESKLQEQSPQINLQKYNEELCASFYESVKELSQPQPKQEAVTVPQQIPEEPLPSSSEQKEKYKYEFALTNDVIRKCIIDEISPIQSSRDLLNLQLAYGVIETKEHIFLTRISSTNWWDDDTGEAMYKTNFIALIEDKCLRISYTSKDMHAEGEVSYDIPTGYEEMLIPALELWRDYKKRDVYEKELQKTDKDFSFLSLNNKLCKPLYKLLPEEKPIEKKHFPIEKLEDAKELFYLCKTDCYRTMKENYDEETIAVFNQYVSDEQKKKWIVEDCEAILREIIEGNTEKLYKKLSTVSGKCNYWLSDPDDLAELYTEACRVLFSGNKLVPLSCLSSYLDIYKKRFNALHIVELLDLIEEYLNNNYGEEIKEGKYSNKAAGLNVLCKELKGSIAELGAIDNVHNFSFGSVPENVISTIVTHYHDKYGDIESVKEILVEFNSLYGVQNEEIFITALRDACDKMHNESFDKYIFVAVMLKTGGIEEVNCINDKETGRLHIEFPTKIVPETLVNDAVMFYRNQLERQKFFEQIYPGEKYIFIKVSQARREFMKSLGSSFQNLLDGIGDNPLKETLEKFIEMCEDKLPDYGIERMKIKEPAVIEEIDAWELHNGVKLPESYRNFLMFANGFHFRGCSEYIVGLDGIDLNLSHLEPDYMCIGEMIGDGATLCLSKSTGEAYVEDHGEYKKKGDFKDLLEYLIDFMY